MSYRNPLVHVQHVNHNRLLIYEHVLTFTLACGHKETRMKRTSTPEPPPAPTRVRCYYCGEDERNAAPRFIAGCYTCWQNEHPERRFSNELKQLSDRRVPKAEALAHEQEHKAEFPEHRTAVYLKG